MKHHPLSEEQIIERIRRLAVRRPPPSVRLGIGDDAAVLAAPAKDRELLLTSDQVIEGTHFIRGQHPPRALGHKSLARGLSDIAAMGGTPQYYLLSLCLPAWVEDVWLKHYLRGMFHLCQVQKLFLVGGDVARGERFSADITVVGTVPRGAALSRGGAKPGDLIYVSGRLGGATLGLERLRRGETTARSAAVRRHLYPQPRLSLGRFLRQRIHPTAAMDLSDGLSMDLSRLTRASGVGAEIQAADVQRFRGATLEQALHGGEDYELLFTVPASVRVPRRFEKLELSRIGSVRAKVGLVVCSEAGEKPLRPEGFQHFGLGD